MAKKVRHWESRDQKSLHNKSGLDWDD